MKGRGCELLQPKGADRHQQGATERSDQLDRKDGNFGFLNLEIL
jgi:hypothetical protein